MNQPKQYVDMMKTQQTLETDAQPSLPKDGFFFAPIVPSSLLLENGMIFSGMSPEWQKGTFDGEVVFTTGMTGYDAALTDPSYYGQILVFTYPLLGNYGVPDNTHWESDRIYASGVVVGEACLQWSHAKSIQSFLHWLHRQNTPVIVGLDTRQLTKVLREAGAMHGAITSTKQKTLSLKPNMTALPAKVSISEKIVYGKGSKKVIIVDCGMKLNILRLLLKYNFTIHRVPYNYDYSQEHFDGLFLSNGPGDPEIYQETIHILRKAMQKEKLIFGVCLGAQLLALAGGGKTYKLPYGHRGHNQPCMDLVTRKCYITSQNHGYAIQENTLPDDWLVSFRNLNDGTVEGISHRSLPFSGVQFHPESAPGPTDTEWLFEKFSSLL